MRHLASCLLKSDAPIEKNVFDVINFVGITVLLCNIYGGQFLVGCSIGCEYAAVRLIGLPLVN